MSASALSLLALTRSEFGSTGLGFGFVSGPFSEPGSLGSLDFPAGGFAAAAAEAEAKEVVQATMSRSRRMCATASSSV